MITVNKYLQYLKDFFNRHNLINTVLVSSNSYDFNSVENIVYPCANIEFISESKRGYLQNTTFEVTVADLLDETSSNEVDIYSDSNLIANDCVTFFSNQDDVDYDINDSVSFQKFSNSNIDNTSGTVFILTFTQYVNTCVDSLPVDAIKLSPDAFTEEFAKPFGTVTIYTEKLIYFKAGYEDTIVDINEYKSSNLVSATFFTNMLKTFNILIKEGEKVKITCGKDDLSERLVLKGFVSVNNDVYSHFVIESDKEHPEINIELIKA